MTTPIVIFAAVMLFAFVVSAALVATYDRAERARRQQDAAPCDCPRCLR